MGTPLYTALRDSLGAFTAARWAAREPALANHSGTRALPPIDPDTLRGQVAELWAATGTGEPSTGKRADVLRYTLEMVARDVAVRPVMTREVSDAARGQWLAFQLLSLHSSPHASVHVLTLAP